LQTPSTASSQDELAQIELEIAKVRLQRERLALEEEQRKLQPPGAIPIPAAAPEVPVNGRSEIISWWALFLWACFFMAVLWLSKPDPGGWMHTLSGWGFVIVLFAGIGKFLFRIQHGPPRRSASAGPKPIDLFREGMRKGQEKQADKASKGKQP
jgi:hypothetical protein